MTRQRSSFVLPITSFTPFLNWSIFECFNLMEMVFGERALSTAMSEKQRYVCGSNFDSHCTVTSPDLQKSKKVVVDAAHSIALLNVHVGLLSNHTLLSLRKIEGVMGRHGQGCLPILTAWTLMPLST